MRRLAVLGVAIAALLSAWIAATRPFGAPDEVDHYLRAAGIANGQLLGPKVPWLDPRLPAAQNRWAGLDARAARVSLQSSPPGRTCIAGTQRGGLRGSCLEATHTGDYQPLPYLLPAFSLAVTHGVGTGLWVSRASSALQCLAFLVLAMALLWSGEALSLLGFLAAVSPQVLFICAVLNPNGLEVAAGSAFAAGLLRISRAPARASAWVWAAVAISGCVTVLSWQLGPAFVAFDLALFASLCGRGKWAQARLTHPVALAATGLVILVSLALYLTYGLSSGALHSPFALTPVGPNLRLGLTQLAPLAHQAVGVFGSSNIYLPAAAYWIWWLLVLTLLASALILARPRERLLLVGMTLFALVFPVAFDAWIYHYSGFPLQARYVLPVLVLVPLLAGETVLAHRARVGRSRTRRLIPLAFAVAGAFQLWSWVEAVSAAAHRSPRLALHPAASWQPPLGWVPWALLAALGALAIAGSGTASARGPLAEQLA